VFKKRRTSSKAPVSEAQMFEEQVDLAADPKGDEWEDLDAEDADDPLVVSEHVVEIFKYMKEVEKTTMPNPLYMDSQKELAWTMRGILTDWLVQVCVRFHLMPETLFLAVNIIDRFFSARVVSLAKLQLVASSHPRPRRSSLRLSLPFSLLRRQLVYRERDSSG